MKTDDIRRLFLEFFGSKGHEVVASDSLVPKDDLTLLFTGAGMNQFKDKFLGRGITCKRATSCQKCLRTADLENAGKTAGHHTFFEMLGNFSFGDYFKKDAIAWAWEFLTEKLKLKPDRLWVSVYKDDDEARLIWKDTIRVPEARIVKLGEKDNFWPSEAPTKGPNGPCGPCSEIFYDYGKDVGCGKPGCGLECDCGRFVEVWNLVFTQFDRQPDGSLKPLPGKNIDTGMGLERLASVMQGVKTNFEIDVFKPILNAINNEIRNTNDERRIRAIADHIRAVVFTIGDGVMPSNEERGYVVRKLIRRAAIHGQNIGIKRPFLYKIVAVITDVMKSQYSDLNVRRDEITQIVKREEEGFLMVVETQVPKVQEAFSAARGKGDSDLAGIAFNFYDTYGMPYEMLEEIAEKFNLRIDKDKFEDLLEGQRRLSRSRSKIKGEIFTETFAKKVEALGLKTDFLGHDKPEAHAKVLAVMDGGEVILDSTPFYGESGGQVGDWGSIETLSGAMEVEDAKKIGNAIVHVGRMLRGHIVKGETAKARIDETMRMKVMANHTATHLLQAALRQVLGLHVRQTGSLVDAEHLRFDFTHMKKMEPREIARVEDIVNRNIKSGISVRKEIKELDEARHEGATALFGERYDAKVRVITIGDVSKELCGGTHVDNTRQIGIFKITAESSIAAGVRRIEAVTSDAAKDWMRKQKEIEDEKLKEENAKAKAKEAAVQRTLTEIKRLDDIISGAKVSNGIKVIADTIKDFDMEGLKKLNDKIREREKSVVTILASVGGDKVSFIVSVTDDIVKKGISADGIVKYITAIIGGSGGGRPGFARGGGNLPEKLPDAIEKAIKEKIV